MFPRKPCSRVAKSKRSALPCQDPPPSPSTCEARGGHVSLCNPSQQTEHMHMSSLQVNMGGQCLGCVRENQSKLPIPVNVFGLCGPHPDLTRLNDDPDQSWCQEGCNFHPIRPKLVPNSSQSVPENRSGVPLGGDQAGQHVAQVRRSRRSGVHFGQSAAQLDQIGANLGSPRDAYH